MEEASSQMFNNPIEERKAPSFFSKYKFTIITVGILVIALIPLVVLTQNHKKSIPQQAVTTNTAVTKAPSVAPLTQQNVQLTLDGTDQQIQQALDDSQTELNAVSQINSSADSTSGL